MACGKPGCTGSATRESIPDDPRLLPLVVKPRADGRSADLFFAPYRDESQETMTLRLIAATVRTLSCVFRDRAAT